MRCDGDRMRLGRLVLAWLLPGLVGCGGVRVAVDCRVTAEGAEAERLNGPVYRIVGTSPQLEASLEFQEYAGLVAAALAQDWPELRRAEGPPTKPGESENLVLTLGFQVIDRGTQVYSYPVYGHRSTTVYTRHGVYRGYSSGYAGEAVDAVHLGFVHAATLLAWVPDRERAAGRLVLWEGSASVESDDPDLRKSMPYLAVSLAGFYGRATERQAEIKFKRHDPRVERISSRRHGGHGEEERERGRGGDGGTERWREEGTEGWGT